VFWNRKEVDKWHRFYELNVTPVSKTTMYGDSVDNTVELPNPNALVAISNGMRAVKLCNNKILQFLTGGAG